MADKKDQKKEAYKWEMFDPNADYKAELTEGHDDCVVRALMIITGKTWLQCYDIVAATGREIRAMTDTWDTLDHVLQRVGYNYHPYNEGEKSPTVAQFAREHLKGIYILDMPFHVSPLKDGVNYDSEKVSRRKLLGYWAQDEADKPEKKKAKTTKKISDKTTDKKATRKDNTEKHIKT